MLSFLGLGTGEGGEGRGEEPLSSWESETAQHCPADEDCSRIACHDDITCKSKTRESASVKTKKNQ